MHTSTTNQRILTSLAGLALLVFTAWFAMMVNLIIALFFLLGSIWFVVQGFKANKPAIRTASIVIVSVAGAVGVLTAAYFVWIGGYTF